MHRHTPNLLMLTILILSIVVTGLVLTAGYQWANLFWPWFIHSVQTVAEFCETMTHTVVASPVFPLVSLMTVVTGWLAWRLFHQPIRTIHALREQILTARTAPSKNMTTLLRHLAIQPHQLCLIDVGTPFVFCLGLIHPRIYLSTGLAKQLTQHELTVVLAHERQHLAAFDPLRAFVTTTLARLLFFIPVVQLLAREVLLAQEILADEAALRRVDKKTFLETIVRMEQIVALQPANLGLGFESLINHRLRRLTKNTRGGRFRRVVVWEAGKSILILTLLAIIILLPLRAQARTDPHNPPAPICQLEDTNSVELSSIANCCRE